MSLEAVQNEEEPQLIAKVERISGHPEGVAVTFSDKDYIIITRPSASSYLGILDVILENGDRPRDQTFGGLLALNGATLTFQEERYHIEVVPEKSLLETLNNFGHFFNSTARIHGRSEATTKNTSRVATSLSLMLMLTPMLTEREMQNDNESKKLVDKNPRQETKSTT